MRPDLGLRRRDRQQPPSGCHVRRPGGRDLHRGARGTRRSRPMRWPCSSSGRTFACWSPSPLGAAASSCAPSVAASSCSQATRSTRRATTLRPGPSRRAELPTTATLADLAFAWRAVRAVQLQRHRPCTRRRDRGVGMGQVNRVDAARLAVARAGEERLRDAVARLRRLLPVPRRPRGARSRPGCARSSSPAVRCATTRCALPPRRPA